MMYNVTVIVKAKGYRKTFKGIEAPREGLAKTRAISLALNGELSLDGQLVEYEVEQVA